MAITNILVLARKELRETFRNKWFILQSIAFAALALALSALTLSGLGGVQLGGFGRTAASLINAVMLFVPLIGLSAGASALAGERERGTLAYLLAQPVTRSEVLFGKVLGGALALAASLALGFGLAGGALALAGGAAPTGAYLRLAGFALLLGLGMFSLGLFISALSRKAAAATGVALFLWLVLVFLGDLGLMGTSLALGLDIQQTALLALANPLQVFKLSAVLGLEATLEVLGPPGLYLVRTFGPGLVWALAGILAAWALLPLAGAFGLFVRRGDL
jgi:Cu-processing system permease protein